MVSKNIGCSVIGITLSDIQKNQAEEHARLQGLSLKASFCKMIIPIHALIQLLLMWFGQLRVCVMQMIKKVFN